MLHRATVRPADQWVGGLKACRAQVASVMREDHANGGLRDKVTYMRLRTKRYRRLAVSDDGSRHASAAWSYMLATARTKKCLRTTVRFFCDFFCDLLGESKLTN